MADPTRLDPHRRTLERIKELEHEHRRTARGFWSSPLGLALSLRFLRTAAGQMLSPMRRPRAWPVRRPGTAEMALTFVGHATVMLTTARARVLTDPLLTDRLFGLRRGTAACLAEEDAADVSLVLISHAHRDHLHPRSLARLPRTATIATPPRCSSLVARMGFARVVELAPGETLEEEDVLVTAVPARHDAGRGFGDVGWRAAGGYVVQGGGASVYFAGDTGYFSGFAEIGERLRPDVALLPITGYEPPPLRASHMSPLDALFAFEDLGARLLVPIAHGSFPLGYEPPGEPAARLASLCAERGLRDRLLLLEHGETCRLRRSATAGTPMDVPPLVG